MLTGRGVLWIEPQVTQLDSGWPTQELGFGAFGSSVLLQIPLDLRFIDAYRAAQTVMFKSALAQSIDSLYRHV